jgi:hypothetical protein
MIFYIPLLNHKTNHIIRLIVFTYLWFFCCLQFTQTVTAGFLCSLITIQIFFRVIFITRAQTWLQELSFNKLIRGLIKLKHKRKLWKHYVFTRAIILQCFVIFFKASWRIIMVRSRPYQKPYSMSKLQVQQFKI